MCAVPFRPSDVALTASFPPLCGTMGRTERELAAAIVVRACQAGADEWRPVPLRALAQVLDDDTRDKRDPIAAMSTNPFCRPDLNDLVDAGFAVYSGKPGVDLSIAFTDKGLEAMRRWVPVRPPAEKS